MKEIKQDINKTNKNEQERVEARFEQNNYRYKKEMSQNDSEEIECTCYGYTNQKQ